MNKYTMISFRIPNTLLVRVDAQAKKLEKKSKAKLRGFRSQVLNAAIVKGLR